MKKKSLIMIMMVLFGIQSVILPAAATQKTVKLTATQTKKMQTFFDNFFEQNRIEIETNKMKSSDLVTFGIWHNYKNYYDSRLLKKGDKYFVSKKHILETVKKYFDINLKQFPSGDYYQYTGSGYLFIGADGDNGEYSRVSQVVDMGKGILAVKGKFYSNSDICKGEFSGTFTATIKRYTFKGVNTYAMIRLDAVRIQ